MALWKHQKKGINFVKKHDGCLLYWGMGSGKSYAAIAAIKDIQAQTILIVCPKQVIRTWVKQFDLHAKDAFDLIVPMTGTVKKKAAEIEKRLNNKRDKRPKVVIVNFESCWRPGLGHTYKQISKRKKIITDKGLFRKTHWDVIVCDECFIADTPIDTPVGPINIQDLKTGDKVYGYDHENSRVVITRVKETMANPATSNTLCNINGNIGTFGHPYYTMNGYKEAISLDEKTDLLWKRVNNGKIERIAINKKTIGMGSEIRSTPQNGLYDLRKTTYKKTSPSPPKKEKKVKEKNNGLFLRKVLFSNMENATNRRERKNLHKRKIQKIINYDEQKLIRPRVKSKKSNIGKSQFSRESFCQKQKRNRTKSSQNTFGARIYDAEWRERDGAHKATNNVIGSADRRIRTRLENRIPRIGEKAGTLQRTSLQYRHCLARKENRNRNSWPISSFEKGNRKGCKEKRGTGVSRMGSPRILERRNINESAKYITVYNIETETGNYFANGLLVHNCHKIKAPGSQVSMFMKMLMQNSDKRIGLSGTPMPNSPLDIYGIYRFLNPDIFGTSFQRFRMRYAIMGGFENRQVEEYVNQDELNKKLFSIADRVKTEDVLKLPDVRDIYMDVQLSPKGEKLYQEFMEETILEFQNGEELTAANAMVKNLRLAQIASGIVTDDAGNEHMVDTSKLEMLKELISNIDEPIVIFTRFRVEVREVRKMIEKMIEAKEKTCGVCQIASGIDERDRFESGDADIAIVNLQAGGTGLNELVRARYAFYYSTGYSLGDYEQSKARICRPGSDINKEVLYYHLIAENTIDEVIKRALEKKRSTIDAVVEYFARKAGIKPAKKVA